MHLSVSKNAAYHSAQVLRIANQYPELFGSQKYKSRCDRAVFSGLWSAIYQAHAAEPTVCVAESAEQADRCVFSRRCGWKKLCCSILIDSSSPKRGSRAHEHTRASWQHTHVLFWQTRANLQARIREGTFIEPRRTCRHTLWGDGVPCWGWLSRRPIIGISSKQHLEQFDP